jgi:VanZ family protein
MMFFREFLNSSKRREQFFRYAPLILWVGLVLYLSTGQASMSQTSRIIRPLLEFFFPGAPEETLIVYHSYIRKFAHFAEYGILAFWASRAFTGSPGKFLRKYWFIWSFLLVVLVASVDETNQSFLASRTGSISDVLLDVSGGLTMIAALALYRFIFRHPR